MPKSDKKLFLIIFITVLTVFVVGYLIKLNYEYFFTDEILYVKAGEEYIRGVFSLNLQHTLLAKYIAGLSYVIFGKNEALLRLPFALMALGTGLVAFLISRILHNKWVGLFVMIVLLSSSFFFTANRMVMMESPMHLFWALFLLFFVKYLQQNFTFSKNLILTAVFAGLSVATKVTSFTLIPFFIIGLFIFGKKQKLKVIILFFLITFVTLGLSYSHFLITNGVKAPVMVARAVKDVLIDRNSEGKEHVIGNTVYEKSPWWFYIYYLVKQARLSDITLYSFALAFVFIKRDKKSILFFSFFVINLLLFQYLALKNARYISSLILPLALLSGSFVYNVKFLNKYLFIVTGLALSMMIGFCVNVILLQPTKYRALQLYIENVTSNYTTNDRLFLFGSVRSSRWHFENAPEDKVIFRKDYEVMYPEFPHFKYIALDQIELLKNQDNLLNQYVQQNLGLYDKIPVDGFDLYVRSN